MISPSDGILLVDKPVGWTSHDVVAKVRGELKRQTGQKVKVGHSGTLDPFATGLLVLLVGSYTKKASEFSNLDKVYEAELTLGFTSSTGDPEGVISKKQNVKSKKPTEAEVKQVLNKFVGQITQTPPVFSAIKVDGHRAYKLARAGKDVKLEPRSVKIYEITDVKYGYPRLSFTCRVSSGTYIRSLAEDIGEDLDTGAYLSDLRRTRVGEHSVADASAPDEVVAKTPRL